MGLSLVARGGSSSEREDDSLPPDGVVVEPHSRIRIRIGSSKVLAQMRSTMGVFAFSPLSCYFNAAKPPSRPSGNDAPLSFSCVGVLLRKGEAKTAKSGNGAYGVLQLWDMRSKDESGFPRVVGVLVCSACFAAQYSRLCSGDVLMLVGPEALPPRPKAATQGSQLPPHGSGGHNNENGTLLKVADTSALVLLGRAVDLGVCASQKASGEPCSAPVNLAVSKYCAVHMMAALKAARAAEHAKRPPPRRGNGARVAAAPIVTKLMPGQHALAPTNVGVKMPSNSALTSGSSFVCTRGRQVVNVTPAGEAVGAVRATTGDTAGAFHHTSTQPIVGRGVGSVPMPAARAGCPHGVRAVSTAVQQAVDANARRELSAALQAKPHSETTSTQRNAAPMPSQPHDVCTTSTPHAQKRPRPPSPPSASSGSRSLNGQFILPQPKPVWVPLQEEAAAGQGVGLLDRASRPSLSALSNIVMPRGATSGDILAKAKTVHSAHDELRRKDEVDEVDRAVDQLVEQDRIITALEAITEQPAKGFYCEQCRLFSFSRQRECQEKGHVQVLKETVKRFHQCSTCGCRIPTLGTELPRTRCPRCNAAGGWSRCSAAPAMKSSTLRSTTL